MLAIDLFFRGGVQVKLTYDGILLFQYGLKGSSLVWLEEKA